MPGPVNIGPLHVRDAPVMQVGPGDTLEHPVHGIGRILGVDPLTLLAEVIFQSEQRTRKLPVAFMSLDPFGVARMPVKPTSAYHVILQSFEEDGWPG